ncbi:hypothetical protein HMPREF1287_00415 [Corynebacterium sp. KPL1986]|nr:hypothetical protein HMPREF1293_01239 [Corynebacterium sp. KPL1996]ERS45975.1 hypothetical protein HMPREF1287_00415 [Corynebacterium sp. KPL1986]ERS70368.1 hypothetical protein HMPREF1300_02047 [Corynebacterium sp. KPL2004]ERS70463.1 hypothetical protein HMPREF1295_01680 [Corynebacterium sp. KPL1998]
MTNAVYTKPFFVRTYVMSATHSLFKALGFELTLDQIRAQIWHVRFAGCDR